MRRTCLRLTTINILLCMVWSLRYEDWFCCSFTDKCLLEHTQIWIGIWRGFHFSEGSLNKLSACKFINGKSQSCVYPQIEHFLRTIKRLSSGRNTLPDNQGFTQGLWVDMCFRLSAIGPIHGSHPCWQTVRGGVTFVRPNSGQFHNFPGKTSVGPWRLGHIA